MRTSSICAAALVAACAAPRREAAARPADAGIPADALGLSKTSVFAVPTPPAVKENAALPGDVPVVPRAFPGAPPVIPHDVRDFTPITAQQNACADCHATRVKTDGGPTPLPGSHYTDYRLAPDRVGDKLVGTRWVCTACHVARTDAGPLVGNSFASGKAAPAPR